MVVNVEDLRKGDVVLIGTNARVFEVKLLRQPTLSKTGAKTWWGLPKWTSIPCECREEIITKTHTDRHGNSRSYNYRKLVIADGQEYNKQKRIDFTERNCWLIKREN